MSKTEAEDLKAGVAVLLRPSLSAPIILCPMCVSKCSWWDPRLELCSEGAYTSPGQDVGAARGSIMMAEAGGGGLRGLPGAELVREAGGVVVD